MAMMTGFAAAAHYFATTTKLDSAHIHKTYRQAPQILEYEYKIAARGNLICFASLSTALASTGFLIPALFNVSAQNLPTVSAPVLVASLAAACMGGVIADQRAKNVSNAVEARFPGSPKPSSPEYTI